MTALSAHFTIEEAIFSQTAARAGIDNDPTLDIVMNMKEAALGLEQVRARLNSNPIRVSSWYRCEALERVICRDAYHAWCIRHGKLEEQASWAEYFKNKAHPKGFAIDFTCDTYGSLDTVIGTIIASGIPFQQIIREFDSWVHIDFSGAKREALIIDNSGTRPYQ